MHYRRCCSEEHLSRIALFRIFCCIREKGSMTLSVSRTSRGSHFQPYFVKLKETFYRMFRELGCRKTMRA